MNAQFPQGFARVCPSMCAIWELSFDASVVGTGLHILIQMFRSVVGFKCGLEFVQKMCDGKLWCISLVSRHMHVGQVLLLGVCNEMHDFDSFWFVDMSSAVQTFVPVVVLPELNRQICSPWPSASKVTGTKVPSPQNR